MLNDELMKKISDLMQDNEMIFLKGQLRNIVAAQKEDKSVYYLADIKVPRSCDTDSVYGVSFNLCHVCFSSEFVKKSGLTVELMKKYKDNEVLLNLNSSSSIKQFKGQDGQTYKTNNIKYFVQDMILLQEISKPDYIGSARKVVNI